MPLCWSRDNLFAFSRVRCELEQSLRETVSQLGLHRRGRRAGRRQPAVAGVVTSPRPASNVNNNNRSADAAAAADGDTLVPGLSTAVRQRPTNRIPTAIGRQTSLTKNRHQQAARKRVLIRIQRSPTTVQPTNVNNNQLYPHMSVSLYLV